jgi:hypothetical protein
VHAVLAFGACAGVGAGADLLSHECTFGADMGEKAHIAQHSTAPMAGAAASLALPPRMSRMMLASRFRCMMISLRTPAVSGLACKVRCTHATQHGEARMHACMHVIVC